MVNCVLNYNRNYCISTNIFYTLKELPLLIYVLYSSFRLLFYFVLIIIIEFDITYGIAYNCLLNIYIYYIICLHLAYGRCAGVPTYILCITSNYNILHIYLINNKIIRIRNSYKYYIVLLF